MAFRLGRKYRGCESLHLYQLFGYEGKEAEPPTCHVGILADASSVVTAILIRPSSSFSRAPPLHDGCGGSNAYLGHTLLIRSSVAEQGAVNTKVVRAIRTGSAGDEVANETTGSTYRPMQTVIVWSPTIFLTIRIAALYIRL